MRAMGAKQWQIYRYIKLPNALPGFFSGLRIMQQKDLLQPHLTVLDNVALPLFIRGVEKSQAREEACIHFQEFGLEGTEKKYPTAFWWDAAAGCFAEDLYVFTRCSPP